MPSKDKKPLKKRIIIVFLIILAVLLLLYTITLILPFFVKEANPEESEYIADFHFYPADYSEDIFEDDEYLALIRDGILIYDNNSNFATTVTKENANQLGDAGAVLLVDMVYAIIEGNAKEYNSLFSEKYFENHEPKESFTMQKIYNGKITYFSSGSETVDGVTYTTYTYNLIYNIFENNGTFRKDIGDDARMQYIKVSEREGKLLIDDIQYVRYYK